MAVLLGGMWLWHREGMVLCTAQVGQCVRGEGLCAALELCAVNAVQSGDMVGKCWGQAPPAAPRVSAGRADNRVLMSLSLLLPLWKRSFPLLQETKLRYEDPFPMLSLSP